MIKKLISYLFKDFYFFTAAYSNQVFPDPLSKEEEEKYLERMKLGDKEARNILIEHNLRLVAHIVKKYEHSKEDSDDLISIGTIGLIKGIDSYSYKHGTRITTYCARCIENEILMYFRSNKKNSKNISLNEMIGFDKDGNEISFLDILKTPDPEYDLDLHQKENIINLRNYFNILNDREKEIAKELGISRSYVSRIEKRALTKMLREFIKNKNIN